MLTVDLRYYIFSPVSGSDWSEDQSQDENKRIVQKENKSDLMLEG